MEHWIELGLAVLLTLLALGGCVGNIVGLPGNWFMVVLAACCFWLRPESVGTHVELVTLAVLIGMAGVGEALEFLAGAMGASRMGGSRRGTALAMGGSIAGAIAGLIFGNAIPIPILGPLAASLLLGASGAFAGAAAGERWAGKDWDSSLQIGGAAFWGRLLGTVGKAVCGTIVCGIFLFAIWF